MNAAYDDAVDSQSVAELRAHFRGALIQPGEEGYDEARRVWNGAIDRCPALIARCAGTDDVVAAVRFAREQGLLVSVRGGGHGIAGDAVCEGGLMIDLSLMKTIRVDPAARTARAAGGVLWAELDRATQQFGLATTGGTVSATGIAGLTLGGGLGHLMRKHGLTVDNLLSVNIVTAEGERMHVDAKTEPDLFWGLRGGGGNFGIATAFEYRLHPVGPFVLAGPILWALDDAPQVLRFLGEFMPGAPDELGITVVLSPAPPLPFLAPAHFGVPAIWLIIAWAGDPAEGDRAMAPLRGLGTPLADGVRPIPYLGLQSMLDGGPLPGRHYYWKAQRLPALPDAAIGILLERMGSLTTPLSQISGWVVGGAASRVAADATAVGDREPGFELSLTAGWPPSDANGGRHKAWVREGWQALRPYSSGVYANFISDEGAAGVQAAYGARLQRLTALKDRCDPDNFFRMNANIPPSRQS